MACGPFKDFGDCVNNMKAQGHDDESANNICGALKAKGETLSQLARRVFNGSK